MMLVVVKGVVRNLEQLRAWNTQLHRFHTFSRVFHCNTDFVKKLKGNKIGKQRRFTRMSAVEEKNEVLEKPAQLAVKIFQGTVQSVKPKHLLKNKFKLENGKFLKIDDGSESWKTIDLSKINKIHVVGFGKAVLPMAEQVKTILGDKVAKCIVNIPEGFRGTKVPGIEINRGAKHNIPDEAAFEGTKKIVQLLQDSDPDDLLIVLITGGGSALLFYPLHPITITELRDLVKTLSRKGATIQELNSVRKRLSLVKGGGLLSLCRSHKLISLILSDVLDDPLDIIASGPTVPNPDTETRAREIIEKYIDFQTLSPGIKEVLKNPIVTPPTKDVTNVIIGSNTIALKSAASLAKKLNLYPAILTSTLSGEAAEVGADLGQATQAISYLFRAPAHDLHANPAYARTIIKAAEKLNLHVQKAKELSASLLDQEFQAKYDGVCVLLGGETTVNVRGKGVGGRNQELVMSASLQIDACSNNPHVKGKVALLSAGTDGYDGPCDAAGAVTDSSTVRKGYKSKLSASEYLRDNNSYAYFKSNSNGIYHILTGHTGTNVMDLVLIVVVK